MLAAQASNDVAQKGIPPLTTRVTVSPAVFAAQASDAVAHTDRIP